MRYNRRRYQTTAPGVPTEVRDAAGRLAERNRQLELEVETLRSQVDGKERPETPEVSILEYRSTMAAIHAEYNRRLLVTGLVIVTLAVVMALAKLLGPER